MKNTQRIIRFDIRILHCLQAGEFGNPAGDYIGLIHIIEIFLDVDFLALRGVRTHLEADTLILETGDLGLYFISRIAIIELRSRLRIGCQQQGQPLAVHDNLQVQILRAHGVNMILDIAQGTRLGLRVVVVDVIDDFLFAVPVTSNDTAGKQQGDCCD